MLDTGRSRITLVTFLAASLEAEGQRTKYQPKRRIYRLT